MGFQQTKLASLQVVRFMRINKAIVDLMCSEVYPCLAQSFNPFPILRDNVKKIN